MLKHWLCASQAAGQEAAGVGDGESGSKLGLVREINLSMFFTQNVPDILMQMRG